jgi:hypothetical protein
LIAYHETFRNKVQIYRGTMFSGWLVYAIYFHPWSQDLAFLLGSLASATISGDSFARAFSTRDATFEAAAACAPTAAAARKRERAAGREGGAAGNRKRGEEERELQNCSNRCSCCRTAAGQEK